MQNHVSLRPVSVGDEAFLFALYASTRQEELAAVPWSEQEKEGFLRTQFTAQARCYGSEYPGAEFQIILVQGEPAGRLYVHRREKEIRIMDIALLPAFRGQGIGSSLLKKILAEAAECGKTVTIHVEVFNAALRLYERLGFRQLASNGLYHLMEWSGASASSAPELAAAQAQSA